MPLALVEQMFILLFAIRSEVCANVKFTILLQMLKPSSYHNPQHGKKERFKEGRTQFPHYLQ